MPDNEISLAADGLIRATRPGFGELGKRAAKERINGMDKPWDVRRCLNCSSPKCTGQCDSGELPPQSKKK